jgi:hypothetical protein
MAPDAMVGDDGLVTLEKVRVIACRANSDK